MPKQLRNIAIVKDFMKFADASCLFQMGDTKVVSTITVQENVVPPHAKAEEIGWILAEYSMLPGSSRERVSRTKSMLGGRHQEIQRIIGRALRGVVDLRKLGNRTLLADCDVLQADGGTRTAAINSAFVAMVSILNKMVSDGQVGKGVVKNYMAAVSAGIVDGQKLIDLTYDEDKRATVDMSVVMDANGKIIELQATGEKGAFSRNDLNELLDMSWEAIKEIISHIKRVVSILP